MFPGSTSWLFPDESSTRVTFTIGNADECYRTFVESMRQGAVTVAREGTILYCYRYFAELMRS